MKTIKVRTENGLQIALHHYSPDQAKSAHPPVLYVHGATFPSALSVGFRFDGFSWSDDLMEAGFDVWSFDFIGFGGSDRAPEDPDGEAPGRFPDAVQQVEAAALEVLRQTSADRLSIIAHSWGTLPAGGLAAARPDLIDRLVLFGPIAMRKGGASPPAMQPTRSITLKDQYDRFVADVPSGAAPILSDAHFAEWGKTYLASGADSPSPSAVIVPAGPAMDIATTWTGQFPYDPAKVQATVLIVRGEWDSLTTDQDAAWLYTAFENAPEKQDIKLSRATHLAHLEAGRFALYRASRNFLASDTCKATARTGPVAVIFEVHPKKGRKSGYLDIAAEMRPILDNIEGFISVERFQSLTDPSKILSLSFFEDEEAIARWRNLNAHRRAQAKGRGGVFDDYRLRIASVIRDYGMFDRAEAPIDSQKAHSA